MRRTDVRPGRCGDGLSSEARGWAANYPGAGRPKWRVTRMGRKPLRPSRQTGSSMPGRCLLPCAWECPFHRTQRNSTRPPSAAAADIGPFWSSNCVPRRPVWGNSRACRAGEPRAWWPADAASGRRPRAPAPGPGGPPLWRGCAASKRHRRTAATRVAVTWVTDRMFS